MSSMKEKSSYVLPTYARSIDMMNGDIAIGTRDGRLGVIKGG